MDADPVADIDELRADLIQVIMARGVIDDAPDTTESAELVAIGQRLTRLLDTLAEQKHRPMQTRTELSSIAGLLRPVCDTFDPLETDPNALADLTLLLDVAMDAASTMTTS